MSPILPPSSRARRGQLFQILGHATPWLVLLLGLAGTGWAWRALTQQERAFQAGRLEGAMAQTREAVEHRIEEQAKALLGAKGLVTGRPRLGAEDWRAFVASLDLKRFSPGTRLLGYISREALEGRRAGPLFLEPESAAAGLGPRGTGLLGQAGFLEAAARARDTGELAVTGRLVLPGEEAPSVAFLLPVYRGFATPGDATARQSGFQGLVVNLADAAEVFRPMYGASPIARLDVEIYDNPECREDGLLYDRDLCLALYGTPMALRPWSRRVALPVGGRRWTLVVGFVAETPVPAQEDRPWLVAVGGGSLTMLAFGLTLFLAHGRARLEALAHRLRESEARFRSVAETASCAIFIYSDRVEYMNDAGCQISGYELNEIVGGPLWKLVHPLDRELVRNRAESRLRGGSVPLRYEFRLLTKQGDTRWIDFAAGTVDLGGRVLGLGTAFDVTERVRANEARLKVERKLFEAQKLESLGLLAGGVAHDFNNLLTVIQGNAGMLRDTWEEPALAQDCLRNIEDTCRRASDLVRQMLAYSGHGRVHVQPLDLNRLIQEIAQLLSISLPKSVSLCFDLADGLPPVEADAAQIQQVVMNLVTNAAEAIGDAEGRVTLRSGLRDLGETDVTGLRVAEALSPGPFVYLEVVDTGPGMDGKTQARIFDPFFTTKFTGRGLGLAAMQGIVRSHGGGVEIQSSPGTGTLFRVYLPARMGAALAAEAPPDRSPAGWRGAGLVLVADDEPGIRDFAKRALERAGFEVILARDGQEAVEHVRAHQSELRLALLDLTMPRLGGDEALADMRAMGFRGPVIRWSGYAGNEASVDLRAVFLQKPFSGEELLMAVQKLVG
ncbi:MAG: PAS domain S-box protein [Geothrix sp.]|nr:PAS domain S-box protein [Geothrix sp.]